jgi:23S rRNA (guanine745-N1)-methyltransferase
MTALDHSLAVLACMHCGLPFERVEQTLLCGNGHSSDIARQGYAAFTAGGGPHHRGDSAAMVSARSQFLAAGHYAPIATAVGEGAARDGWCVELAGGTGYYAARVLDTAPALSGITIDASKNAAKTAARAHERLASLTGDVYATLPIRTDAADLVLSIFGPRRGDEVARILAPGGSLVVVTPRARHLAELRERFSLLAIGADKEARLDSALEPLTLVDRSDLEYTTDFALDDVVNSIMMGPNAFHHERAEIEDLAASLPSPLTVTVAVTVSRFRA